MDLEKLNSLIDSRGVKRTWLSEATGISYRTLNRICNGEQEPKVSELTAIAKALGTKVEKLL